MTNTGTAIIDWLAQPPHGVFDILRLQLAPAFDLGPVTLLWEPLEIVLRMVLAAVLSLVNFSRMNGSLGIAAAG